MPKKKSNLPSTDAKPRAEPPKSKAAAPPPTVAPTINTVSIDVPLSEIPEGAYISRVERVEFRSMTRRQARSLKQLTRGLEDAGRTLEDGTRIKRPMQALRWLLEQIEQPE